MGDEISIITDNILPDGAVSSSIYDDQLYELAEIRNPTVHDSALLQSIANELGLQIPRVNVYYPWRNIAVQMLPEQYFYEIKTNRNQLLISKNEQQLLYDLTISVAGMSVGSSLVFGLIGSGIAKHMILADFDTYSNANLNRVQATVLDIGKNKALVTKQRALEMNPFLDIRIIDGPVTQQNVDQFFKNGSVDLVFEEIDDFKMKVILRDTAKKHKKPLIMLTNLGDSVQADIERYDITLDYQPFHGTVSQADLDSIRSLDTVSPDIMKKLSVQLVDVSLIPQKAMESLQQIGTTLVGRPQLYSTVALDGGIAPFLVRQLFIEKSTVAGRHSLRLQTLLERA